MVTRPRRHTARDLDEPAVKVDVAPLERGRFAEAEPRPRERQHEREVARPGFAARREELRKFVSREEVRDVLLGLVLVAQEPAEADGGIRAELAVLHGMIQASAQRRERVSHRTVGDPLSPMLAAGGGGLLLEISVFGQ